MCGRYASSRSAAELASHFGAVDVPDEELVPSWNIAPTDPVPAVLEREGRRLLRVLRWGLVPSWSKDVKVGARMINARSETLATKPAFRTAFARRRCLLPADGYYEWQRVGADKQPWFLSARDGVPLAMAGVYDLWKAPDGTWVRTCAVITTDAADDTGAIHDRTPLLVQPGDWSRWLDVSVADPGPDLLVAATPGVLDAWEVGAEVGNVRNEGPQLVAPLTGWERGEQG